ncbi:nuclease-related domain-containing protein [Planococcus sp. APC 3906]|uniref:nuclease-related domain-containing protein n=1 Tax=Planococcus sp. APC 3906 TaxID=3035194 RepID=UPI0025B5751E|nr:nuclease-related domain-containing protein [Planococcus sp. APC 3906]MDN3449976.1 nuclease-related domain-containing protein [Planococcus sp. APC 3906]
MKRLTENEALETLLLRLADGHPQRIFLENRLYRTAGGERGEARLQSRFKEFWIDGDFKVLWDVSLALGDWKVQLDGILLTERCALVIESKNISGEIYFNEATGEFFRLNLNGEKTVLEDPRVQLSKHIRFLTRWFAQHKIPLPVSGLAVFTSKHCEFITKPPGAPICKTYQMPDHLLKIWQSHPPKTARLHIAKVSKLLLANQTPFKRQPLCRQYTINPSDIKTGVLCRACSTLSMQREKRGWTCTRCGERDAAAHVHAAREYFSIVDDSLTNRDFRKFCKLESRSVASRLLSKLELDTTGEWKSCVYRLQKKK